MTADFWNERFGGEHFHYGVEPNDFLRSRVGDLPAGTVISLGEGEGRNAVFLAKSGYTVSAVDLSMEGFNKCRKLAAENHVTVSYQVEPLTNGSWLEKTWQSVVNIFCHIPSADRKAIYEKLPTVLPSGGVFLTEQFSVNQLNYSSGGPKDPDMLVTLDEFHRHLSPFFDFKILQEEIVHLDEGHHQGPGSVVRVSAIRK